MTDPTHTFNHRFFCGSVRLAYLVAAIFIVLSCGQRNGMSQSNLKCVPGEVRECACSTKASHGTQICARDKKFGPCRCASETASLSPISLHSNTTRDVCNYQAEVAQRKPDSDNRVVIPPNHPDINYFGRVDCTTPAAPTFSYPGVTIRTGFSGSSIHMDFLDSGNHTNTNYYDVSIDDAPSTRLAMIPGTHTYALAENLRAGAHTIEIFKRVESNYGTGQGTFLGFRIDAGETILPVPPKPYRIEFIGDSITCGYGNTVAVDTPGEYHYTTETANAHKSWAAITAEQIHAELSIVAYSGRGVFRNVNGMKGNTIPKMYFKTLPDHPQGMTWEPNRFIPDIVVINLGTNDFSPSLSESKLNEVRFHYHETTAIFVATLRKTYPQAAIILAVGPMLSDDYPEGYNALSSVTAALRHIVNARSAEGDTNMYFIQLPREASLWGADWHPTETTHRKMADALVTFLRQRRIVL